MKFELLLDVPDIIRFFTEDMVPRENYAHSQKQVSNDNFDAHIKMLRTPL